MVFLQKYYWNGWGGVDLNNSIINEPFSILEVVCAVNLLFCNVECTYWFCLKGQLAMFLDLVQPSQTEQLCSPLVLC